MGFFNLVMVFGCSLVTDYMSKMSCFSTVFTSFFYFSIGSDKLEAVSGCLAALNFIGFWFIIVFDALLIFLPLFFKDDSCCSLPLVGPVNFFVKLKAEDTKYVFGFLTNNIFFCDA